MEEVIVHPKVFISYSWDTEMGMMNIKMGS